MIETLRRCLHALFSPSAKCHEKQPPEYAKANAKITVHLPLDASALSTGLNYRLSDHFGERACAPLQHSSAAPGTISYQCRARITFKLLQLSTVRLLVTDTTYLQCRDTPWAATEFGLMTIGLISRFPASRI